MVRAMNRSRNPAYPWWVWPAVAFAGTVLVAGVGARLWRWHKGRASPLATSSQTPPTPNSGGGGGGGVPSSEPAKAESVYGGGWASQDEAAGLSSQREDGLPLSDRMLLTPNCDGPAAKAVKWRYDIRLTNHFWALWEDGMRDAVLITMELLSYDSPHCEWPPDVNAPEWADIIWDGTFAAVAHYIARIEDGTLSEMGYDAHDPHEGMHVKPLVVWA